MTRPTVIDIAREAGVSLATVDRVLNARPGVRAQTIGAVNDAISRLGYVRDQAAANLARSRNYRMAIVLPDSDSQFVQTLAQSLTDAAQQAAAIRTEARILRFPPEDMHALATLLADLPDDTAGVFNYYETDGQGKINFFGSSKDLVEQGTGPGQVRRCAGCHTGGGLIMKELDTPWMHWEGHENHPGAAELVTANKNLLGRKNTGAEVTREGSGCR